MALIRIAPILWLVCLLAITHSVTAALRLYWRILKRQTKSRSQSRQVVFSDLKARPCSILFESKLGPSLLFCRDFRAVKCSISLEITLEFFSPAPVQSSQSS